MFDAIRASIAAPTIFTPCEHKGLKLLDGGLLNPISIAPTFSDLTDLTIAVKLNGKPSTPKPRPITKARGEVEADDGDLHVRILHFLDSLGASFRGPRKHDVGIFELISRSYETMQIAIVAAKLAAYAPDVVIDVPRNACGAYEFHRGTELIDLGYQLAGATVSKYSWFLTHR